MANTVIIWYNLYARLRERLQSGPAGRNVCLNRTEQPKKAYMRLAAATKSGPAGKNVCLNRAEQQKKAYMRLAAATKSGRPAGMYA